MKLDTPKGRKRGALSFTSNTFMVSLAMEEKVILIRDRQSEHKKQRKLNEDETEDKLSVRKQTYH